jgi:hypothetical protein
MTATGSWNFVELATVGMKVLLSAMSHVMRIMDLGTYPIIA